MTNNDQLWQEAKKCCRLDDEDIALAKRLGLNPRSLIKNIPSKSEPWKAPVKDWLHEIEAKRSKKAEQKQTAPASGGFQIVSESGETDAQVEALLQARYDAKKAKDFTEADRIRDDLKAMGVEITDIPGGVRWKR